MDFDMLYASFMDSCMEQYCINFYGCMHKAIVRRESHMIDCHPSVAGAMDQQVMGMMEQQIAIQQEFLMEMKLQANHHT